MRDWLAALPGVRRDEPLAPHTTYDIGGPAEHYLEIGELAALAEVARSCANYGISLFVIGNGSNIVVADAGIDGVVVRYTDTAITIDGTTVRTAAGARMVKVAQAAAAQGLTGMEWALGIPGTAGAHGGTASRWFRRSRKGQRCALPSGDHAG